MSSLFTLTLLHSIVLKLGKVTDVLASNITDITEVDGRHEARRLPSLGDLGIELVNLLKGQALGLVDEEVDEYKTNATETTPDEEHLSLEVGVTRASVDHVRSRVGDSPVKQPVGGGGDGQALGTGLKGEKRLQ
jgi:hypothetical protein